MSDEDAAFAAAQWASGIPQKAIAAHFGWSSPVAVCNNIGAFIRKYSDTATTRTRSNCQSVVLIAQGDDRRALVKDAIAAFIAARAK